MVHNRIQLPVFMAIAAALTLHGCGQSTLVAFDQGHSPTLADRGAAATSLTARHETLHDGTIAQNFPATHSRQLPSRLGNRLPWSDTSVHDPNFNVQVAALDPVRLSEALHDADLDVRRHALEIWAQNPQVSPEPVAYALNDADESIHVQAQA